MFKTQKGLSLSDVQEHNKSLILRIIHQRGECSRKDISVATGLDQATVTRAVKQLIETGLVDEVSLLKNERGRRSIGISFCASSYRILTLRLQRKSFSVSVFDLLGKSMVSDEYRLNVSAAPPKVFHSILSRLKPFVEEFQERLLGIGVALPGPFLAETEKIILMTEADEWKNFDFLGELHRHLPKVAIFPSHDAKAAALSVWEKKSLVSERSILLYISLGQGIGSAIVINGHVFQGSHGLAGEIGHTSVDINGLPCKCGNHGCLELYASSFALRRRVHKVIKKEVDLSFICEAYLSGEPLIEQEVELTIRYLAQGIANYVNLLNPDVVILGDEYVIFGEKFLSSLCNRLQQLLLPSVYAMLNIDFLDTTEDIVVKGAFLNVLNKSLLGI